MGSGRRISDHLTPIVAFAGVPSGANSTFISLKNVVALQVQVVVEDDNTGSPVAISLVQATNVAGAGAKPLNFVANAWQTPDVTGAQGPYTPAVVSGGVVNTPATPSKVSITTIDVDVSTLDASNNYTSLAVNLGASTHAQAQVVFLCKPCYGGNPAGLPVLTVN